MIHHRSPNLLLIAFAVLACGLPAAAETKLEELPLVTLEAPPWAAAPAAGAKAARGALVQVSQKANQIVDEDAWFAANGLALPLYELPAADGSGGNLPGRFPRSYRGLPLVQASYDARRTYLVYGESFGAGRYLALADTKSGELQGAFDFERFLRAPGGAPGEEEFTTQGILWAVAQDDVLYVATGHHTYARSSGGKNAYLTALSLPSGKLLWRSPPLVANARNFEVVGDLVITGYGFTREPDFVYLLDRRSGAVVARQKVKSGPEILLWSRDRLYVRCYDTDSMFELRR